jgi:hypothetical protein
VLAWVGNGVPIQLVRPIHKTQQSYSLQAEQQAWIKVEVEQSQHMGMVKWMGTGSKQPMGINFVCPIMCVPKKGLKHWWMVHDLHDLNCGLVLRTVHFKGLASLAWMASTGWWLISFDLAQGYHHLLMEEDAHQLLGFQVSQHWYCYHVLPFSLQWSPWIFMKVVKAITTFWWRQGIICMAYIDNFVVLALSQEELLSIHNHTISPTLKQLGWVWEPTKGAWEPTQHAEVLRLVVNLASGLFLASEEKLQAIEGMVSTHLLVCHTKWELAQLAGSINTIAQAVPILQLYLHSTYHIMGHRQCDWNQWKPLSLEAHQDLGWIRCNLWQVNSTPVWHLSRVLRIQTDVSSHSWGVWVPESGEKARGSFLGEETDWPIHCKELMAAVLAIEIFCPKFQNQWIEIESNNTTAVAYLCDRGGSDTVLMQMVKRVWMALQASGCAIYTAWWIHRVTKNQEANALSWLDNPNDWTLLGKTVELLQASLGNWQVDHFAEASNWKAPAFNSHFESPGCQAVNAFSQDWRGWVNLWCPRSRWWAGPWHT